MSHFRYLTWCAEDGIFFLFLFVFRKNSRSAQHSALQSSEAIQQASQLIHCFCVCLWMTIKSSIINYRNIVINKLKPGPVNALKKLILTWNLPKTIILVSPPTWWHVWQHDNSYRQHQQRNWSMCMRLSVCYTNNKNSWAFSRQMHENSHHFSLLIPKFWT